MKIFKKDIDNKKYIIVDYFLKSQLKLGQH